MTLLLHHKDCRTCRNASETSTTDNTVRAQFTLKLVIQVCFNYFKELVLAAFKSSCVISRAEDFACSARVLKAVLRK